MAVSQSELRNTWESAAPGWAKWEGPISGLECNVDQAKSVGKLTLHISEQVNARAQTFRFAEATTRAFGQTSDTCLMGDYRFFFFAKIRFQLSL
jgi:hypothetical protein